MVFCTYLILHIPTQRLNYNQFDENEGGWGRLFSDYTNLFMLIELFPEDWNKQLESTNKRVDEENSLSMEKGSIRELWRYLRNEFRKIIGCIISVTTFGVGGG